MELNSRIEKFNFALKLMIITRQSSCSKQDETILSNAELRIRGLVGDISVRGWLASVKLPLSLSRSVADAEKGNYISFSIHHNHLYTWP